MAVPKKRTGHSAQGSRRAKWKATKPETTKCPNCGATVLAHTVCTQCGTYKGKPVRLADKAAAAVKSAPAATPVVEEKKPAAKKPAAKKATTKKAETETKTTAKKPAAKKTTAKTTAKKAEKEKTEE